MSELHSIAFDKQPDDIKEKVESYWTKRADGFFSSKVAEVESIHGKLWTEELEKLLPPGEDLNILDIGCGAGFFEAVLGNMGHRVTGIDLTEDMILKAERMISHFGLDKDRVKVQIMDAEEPAFEDGTFDVVISRNLTWTLPHPVEAYRQWHRVLKKGGVLLNFDAEYAKNAHTNLYSDENFIHHDLSKDMKDECHRIYHMLTISALARPDWDVEVLKETGFTGITTDMDFGERVFGIKDEFYMPDRLFSIRAVK